MGIRATRAAGHVHGERIARVALACAISACVLALAQATRAPSARAVIARTNAGHLVSYQTTRTRAATARSLAAARLNGSPATFSRTVGASYKPCESQPACLSYLGGPIMHTTTLTPIFWNPSGANLHYPEHYESELEQFLGDVAADSGKESNFFSVLPQYYEESGGKVTHATYSVAVEPAEEDTAALPTGTGEKCTSPFSVSRPCVSDLGVQKELISYIKEHGLGTGIGHEYIVFFPPGMESCFAESGEAGEECSGTRYCGYHGTLEAGTNKEVEYANEPDNADPVYGIGCLPEEGLKAGYATDDSTSHEISESVTDPEIGSEIGEEVVLSWYDGNETVINGEKFGFGEIGDMCAYEYKQGDSALQAYATKNFNDNHGQPNQTINGHSYLLQLEWDNANGVCSLSAEAAASRATFTDNATGIVSSGQPISFDASGSHGPADEHIEHTIKTYEWRWGDGTANSTGSPAAEHAYVDQEAGVKTYTVTLTVTDGNGDTASASHTVEVAGQPPAPTPTPSPAPAATTTRPGIAGAIHVTGVKQNKKKGTVAVSVSVPGAGVLSLREAAGAHSSLLAPLAGSLTAPAAYPVALSAASKAKTKAKGPFVKAVSLNVGGAGNVTLQIAPTAAGKAQLAHKHKLVVKLLIAFTPSGGSQATITQAVTLVLSVAKKGK